MPGKREGKEKPIFKGLVIAVAGDLRENWTENQIQTWIQIHDGTYVREMDGSVTHLLCTLEEYKKKRSKVAFAIMENLRKNRQKNNEKKCFIVTGDWLEDSIHKKQKLCEKIYSVEDAYKEERAKLAKELQAVKAAEPLERPKDSVNEKLYHVYSDRTHFRYEITITRANEDHPQNDKLKERYVLYLWESNSTPHLYVCASKYFKKFRARSLPWRANPSDRKFEAEFKAFQHVFRKKTGINWMERLAKAGTTARTYFQYQPPTGGKPVGVVTGRYANCVYQPQVIEASETVEAESQMQIDTAHSHLPAGENSGSNTTAQQNGATLLGGKSCISKDMLDSSMVYEIVKATVGVAVESACEESASHVEESMNFRTQHAEMAPGFVQSNYFSQIGGMTPRLAANLRGGKVCVMEAAQGHQGRTITNHNTHFVEKTIADAQMVDNFKEKSEDTEAKKTSGNFTPPNSVPAMTTDKALT